MRTTVSCLLYLFLLIKKISLIHKLAALFTGLIKVLAQLTQISKTVNPRFVTIAPAKVERVAANYTDILDFNLLRNAVGLQHTLSSPLVNALSTRTGTPQIGGAIKTAPIVAPKDAKREIVIMLDLSWLNLRSASFHVITSARET
jgi:hypothetical protein